MLKLTTLPQLTHAQPVLTFAAVMCLFIVFIYVIDTLFPAEPNKD